MPAEFLWIGCSDAPIPAEDLTGAAPGELLVHRNIANLVVHTDLNMLALLQYAVDELAIKHIIVCGHYGCGGVSAAMSHRSMGMLNKWLVHVKDTHQVYRSELGLLDDEVRRRDRLVELNTIAQVHNLMKTATLQRAWARQQRPILHGWVYDPAEGLLKSLVEVQPGSPIDDIYRFDFSDPHAV